MRALIIDDSLSMRLYLAAMIEDQGFETEMACDGAEALEKLKEKQDTNGFDMVTVDRYMPVMDGPSFVAAVRADSRYRRMKLLLLTARDDDNGSVKTLIEGVDEYLTKPVTPEILEEKMRRIGLGK